jgi:hypothetical protein
MPGLLVGPDGLEVAPLGCCLNALALVAAELADGTDAAAALVAKADGTLVWGLTVRRDDAPPPFPGRQSPWQPRQIETSAHPNKGNFLFLR